MDKRLILVLPDRPATPHPDDLMWIERIEAIRAEEAPPLCPACLEIQSSVRRCYRCGACKPLSMFGRQAKERLGRSFDCIACRRQIDRRRYLARKRRHIREVFGRSA